MNNCIGVCFNSDTVESYKGDWKDHLQGPDMYAIIDCKENNLIEQKKALLEDIPNVFVYNEDVLRFTLSFQGEVDKGHYWNTYGNKNVIWFYAHFRMMLFYIANPGYDYYWFFDDDVKCNDWESFYKDVKYDSDFLSFFCFKHSKLEDQSLVPVIDSNTHTGEAWFNRFPGPGDLLPPYVSGLAGSFFPVVRFSNKALKHLVEVNMNKFHGYSEGFVPTVLNRDGFTLDTLFNPDNTSRHFNTDSVKITHKNQDITWSWI